jgi:putative ABC transport system ATP-binding protein
MFRIADIRKIYTKKNQTVVALQIDNLQIDSGEYLAVVGRSGSGKSTLLSLLGGMLEPTEGKLWFEDQLLYELPLTERARIRRDKIGFVFQTFNLIPYLTALENVQLPLFLANMPPAIQYDTAFKLLQRVGLEDRIHHKPFELSTGQQQRVALARTLANDPRIILADEPTGNLDPESRNLILDFFDEFHAEGRTIVMVTHDVTAAGRANRQVRLEDGVVDGSNRVLLSQSA